MVMKDCKSINEHSGKIKSSLKSIKGKIYIEKNQITDLKVKPEKFSKVAKEEDKEINNVRDGIKHRKRETGEKIF